MTFFGILNIDKPKGLTSHDIVARLRKILNTKKIGHTGTLDPIATGVLPICIGKATKLIQFLDDSKAYRAYLKLGVRSDSFDSESPIIETNEVKLDNEKIKKCLRTFKGNIEQTPPMHSAVHYKGKRLYEYARKNIEIKDIPTRKVTVNSIELVETINAESKNPTIVVDIDCSSGTYIRSIANDLGNLLGYGAIMEGLTRTRAGVFCLNKSITLEKVQQYAQGGKLDEIIINPVSVINFDEIKLDSYNLDKIKKGQYIKVSNEITNGSHVQLIYENSIAAIGLVKEGFVYPINVFA